ncbi:MAG TPA: IclR family transcriptional regulator [Chloroflexi bacterium]|nr:IclR family transcriptional regulator [Chloroflexota bacterium]
MVGILWGLCRGRKGRFRLTSQRKRYQIRAVDRALELLGVFSTAESEFTLTELSARLNLNPSTTYRLLVTLESRDYIEQNPESGRYRLGVACLRLGSVFLSQVDLRKRALSLLERLRDECKEAVHLAILDRHRMEVVYLEKLEGLMPIGLMSSRVGGRAPAYCTGLGKSMLAYEEEEVVREFYTANGLQVYTPHTITVIDDLLRELSEIRKRGYAIDNAEHEPDVKCVAAPVWSHQHAVVGAISVSGPVERIDRLLAEGVLIEKVKETANEASTRMGCPEPSTSGG